MTTEPAHAPLGPSGANTWMTCPGSVAAQAGLIDETSEFAAEGTHAHEISDACLTFGYDPFDFIGMTAEVDGFKFTWEEEDAEHLLPGIEWIRAQPGQFFGEHKVNLANWLGDGQFGTLDRGIVSDDLIIISDLKFGRGVPVTPVRNKQLMLYALGFWWNVARHVSNATDFLLHIDQPRCAGGGGSWRITLDELLAFGEEAKLAAAATRDPNAPRVASQAGCLWCKRRSAPGGCYEFDRFNLELISQKFEDMDDGEPMELPGALTITPPRRSHILKHRKMIEKWLDNLHASCLTDALAGHPTDGLKAVEGRKAPDKWDDKDAVDAALLPFLGENRFTKKLITPTQCGKALAPEQFKAVSALVIKGDKKPVLVPEEDERPAIGTAQSKFDEEGDD